MCLDATTPNTSTMHHHIAEHTCLGRGAVQDGTGAAAVPSGEEAEYALIRGTMRRFNAVHEGPSALPFFPRPALLPSFLPSRG